MQHSRFKNSFSEKVKNLDWLAGFFDGECCIYFTEKSKCRVQDKDYSYPEVQVIFAQSGDRGFELMSAIKEVYNTGKITTTHGSKLTKQIPYMTRLSGKKAIAFLKLIESHLVLKQEKAQQVISYMDKYYAN